jgi:hypothetical protein
LLYSRTSCRASTTREEVYGQYSEGRTTTVLPQTSGIATEEIKSGTGAFHGTTEYLPFRLSTPHKDNGNVMERT